jgi:hypothetical protein
MPTVGEMLDGLLTEEDVARRASRILASGTCNSADLSILSRSLLKLDSPAAHAAAHVLARIEELLESDKKCRDGHLSRAMGWSLKGTSRSVTDVLIAGAAHQLNDKNQPAKAAGALARMIEEKAAEVGLDLRYGKTAIVKAMKKHPDVWFDAKEAVAELVRVAKEELNQT